MGNSTGGRGENRRFEHIELAGGQVRLRPVRGSDAAAAYQLVTNENIIRWLAMEGPPDEDEVLKGYQILETACERGERFCFAIERMDQAGLVGYISLRFQQQPGHADMGFWLGEPFWNQGYMGEAIKLVSHFCFEHLGLNKLSATVITGNLPSWRALQKNGFKLECTLRREIPKRGHWLDAWYMALLREDWLANREKYLPAFEQVTPADAETIASDSKDTRAGPVNKGFQCIELAGHKVRLRITSPDDAAQGYRLLHDTREINRWLFWGGPRSRRELVETYGIRWPEEAKAGTRYPFAIEETENPGKLIGSIDARMPHYPQQFEVGYWLGVPYWRQGYTAEALALLCHLCFKHLGAVVITSSAFVGNIASRRVQEKNGFRFDGTLRREVLKDGAWVDLWHLSLLPDDWEKQAFKPVFEKLVPARDK